MITSELNLFSKNLCTSIYSCCTIMLRYQHSGSVFQWK